MLRPESSDGIMTDYGLDGPVFNPVGDEILRPFRPALGLTQPPMICLPVFPGIKSGRVVLLTTHPLLEPRPHRACNGMTLPLLLPLPVLHVFCVNICDKILLFELIAWL